MEALLRLGEAAEVHLRIRKVVAEVHRGPTVAGAHQESRHRTWVRQLCFCYVVLVREALAVLPAGVVPHLQIVVLERVHSRKRSDHSGGRLSLQLKTVH